MIHIGVGYEDDIFNVLGVNVDTFESLGHFSGYYACLDLYCMYLTDKPRKVRWNIFINLSFDFFMALALLKRVLSCGLSRPLV